jgi:phage-related protein
MKYEQGYSQGFQRGTNENMKAIQTILKSGDNIQSAIKNFVEEQSRKLQDPIKDLKPEANISK